MAEKPAGAILEATIDDGLNWYTVTVISSTPFTLTADNENNNPNARGWAGNINFDNDKLSRYTLQNYSGESAVRFRINFTSSAKPVASRYGGIGIDSVWIGNRTKKALVEHFTNNGNIPSLKSNDSVNKIQFERSLDVNSLHYHTSFPEYDNFNLMNPVDPSSKVAYYGISSVPTTHLNGKRFTKYGSGPEELNKKQVDLMTLDPSKFKIDLSVYVDNLQIKTATRLEYVDSKGLFQDIVLNVVIIEENKIDNGINYKYTLRTMLPDAAGNHISQYWTKNSQFESTQTWNFNNGNISEMGVIVFVQNYASKEVYQSVYLKGEGTIGNPVIASTKENERLKFNSLFVFPNPSDEDFMVLINSDDKKNEISWELVDALGKKVLSGTENHSSGFKVNTSQLLSGIYTLTISCDTGESYMKKIIINH